MQSGFEKGFDVYYLPPCIDYIIKNTRLIIQDSPTPPTYLYLRSFFLAVLFFSFSVLLYFHNFNRETFEHENICYLRRI